MTPYVLEAIYYMKKINDFLMDGPVTFLCCIYYSFLQYNLKKMQVFEVFLVAVWATQIGGNKY